MSICAIDIAIHLALWLESYFRKSAAHVVTGGGYGVIAFVVIASCVTHVILIIYLVSTTKKTLIKRGVIPKL